MMDDLDHQQLLQSGRVHFSEWRAKNPNVILNLDGAVFSGARLDLTGCTLKPITLRNADLSGANLSGADLSKAKASGCKLPNSDLSNAILNGADLTRADLANSNLTRADLTEADLTDAVLQRCVLKKAKAFKAKLLRTKINNTDLTSAAFVNADLREADLSYSQLSSVQFRGAKLSDTTFSHSKWVSPPTGLEDVDVQKAVANAAIGLECVVWTRPDRFVTWERLRAFGRLPLFGASYTVLAVLPLLLKCIETYNELIAIPVANLAKELAATNDENVVNEGFGKLLRICGTQIPPPRLMLTLLCSTLLLAIASTLYSLRCPPRIREFSRDYWCDVMQQEVVHYLPLGWKNTTSRIICGVCYLAGGLGVLFVLISKLYDVLNFVNHYGV